MILNSTSISSPSANPVVGVTLSHSWIVGVNISKNVCGGYEESRTQADLFHSLQTKRRVQTSSFRWFCRFAVMLADALYCSQSIPDLWNFQFARQTGIVHLPNRMMSTQSG